MQLGSTAQLCVNRSYVMCQAVISSDRDPDRPPALTREWLGSCMLDALPGCSTLATLESDVRPRAKQTDVKDRIMSARLSPIFPPSHLAHLSCRPRPISFDLTRPCQLATCTISDSFSLVDHIATRSSTRYTKKLEVSLRRRLRCSKNPQDPSYPRRPA